MTPRRIASRSEKVDHVLGAVLASGRDAPLEHPADVGDGLEQQDWSSAVAADALADGAVARRRHVRVGVDEPGQDRRVAVLDRLDGRAVGRPEVVEAADALDRRAAQEHAAVLDGLAGGAVEDARRA